MKKVFNNFTNSMIGKLIGLEIICGLVLLFASSIITNNSLKQLEEDNVSSRLKSDINYITDIIGSGDWHIENGDTLYKGEIKLGNGTDEHANIDPFLECESKTGTFSYTFIKCSDEGLEWHGDNKTGYMQGHFLRVAGSTRGPNGESIIGTYMDKKVADILDDNDIYMGPANVNGRQIYCIYITLKNNREEVVGAMVVGRGIEELNKQIVSATIGQLVFILIINIIIAVIILYFVLPWTFQSKMIESYLKKISEGTFPEEPLLIHSKDEMGRITGSINEMVESLKQNIILDDFRKGMKKNAVFSVCVNMTRKVLVEGKETFSRFLEDDGMIKLDRIKKEFIMSCVEPKYLEMVLASFTMDSLISQMDNDPEFDLVFRMSPFIMSKVINLPEEFGKDAKSHEYRWFSLRGVIVHDPSGDLLLYIDVFDVNQKMIKEEKMRKHGMTDALTGLNNRSTFIDEVSEYLADKDNSGALFIVDLDHFKDVNDNLGHPKGDELLKQTASTLTRSFRRDDIICRLGGDEFCIFMKSSQKIKNIQEKADLLNDRGRILLKTQDGREIKVSMSIGIALFPADATDYMGLYNAADKALYVAKESGRDCSCMYGT